MSNDSKPTISESLVVSIRVQVDGRSVTIETARTGRYICTVEVAEGEGETWDAMLIRARWIAQAVAYHFDRVAVKSQPSPAEQGC